MSNESNRNSEIKLDKDLNLANDFSPATYEEWKATAEESLNGAPFDKKLVTPTYEGIDLQPIYTAKDIENLPHLDDKPGFPGGARGNNTGGYLAGSWEVCQEILLPSPNQFNSALKHDLKRGLNSINLVLDKTTKKGLDSDKGIVGETGFNGIPMSTLEDFSTAMECIEPEKYPIHIDAGFSGVAIFSLFDAYLKKQGKKLDVITGSILTDPLAYLVSEGTLPISSDSAFDHMARLTSWASHHAPRIKTIGISGLPYHNAGADAVHELAFVLATAVEYIDRLSERNIPLDTIASSMRFTFGIGPFYFMEVAKIRAARILWSKIITTYGGNDSSQKMTIHGRTSTYNQTVYDPYANMLRTTTEAFAAAVAGVDSIHSNSFDELFGTKDEFSRRTARNVQIVLSEECRLTNLIDPAGGSYFVEKLTHQVAEKTWTLFQQIQTKGGMLKALQEGFPQTEIATVDKKRKADIAKRKQNIVGTNFTANVKEKKLDPAFPDYTAVFNKRFSELLINRNFRKEAKNSEIATLLKEMRKALDDNSDSMIEKGIAAAVSGATLGEIFDAIKIGEPLSINQLKSTRAAVQFEELRDAVEAYKTINGSAPKLFLATMGPLSQYKPRADFSQSFFEIGGFDVIYPQGFETPEDAVKAAVESEAGAVVICSTDDTYPALVPPITQKIKEINPNIIVVLAGYPKDQVEAHKQAGVDEFIYLGVDAHLVISGILKRLGVLS